MLEEKALLLFGTDEIFGLDSELLCLFKELASKGEEKLQAETARVNRKENKVGIFLKDVINILYSFKIIIIILCAYTQGICLINGQQYKK